MSHTPITLALAQPDGTQKVLYTSQPRQTEFHLKIATNVLYIGSRGTGKSLALRMEAHIRALQTPGFRYAIVRKSHPDLLSTHISFIEEEMALFGGIYHKTHKQALYPKVDGKQSIGFFSHVDESELGNMLSTEFHWIGIDEASEIEWTAQQKLAASVRVPTAFRELGIKGMVRRTTNPIGESVEQLKKYFIDKDVRPSEDPYYNPNDWDAVSTKLSDNAHLDPVEYRKQFSGLPIHVQRAWLDGEFVIEGAYFVLSPGHFTTNPVSLGARVDAKGYVTPAPFIYRAIDWGFHPDPAVCLWIAVYPHGRAVVFKERQWTFTTAKQVAADIKADSQGMRIVDTFCDPTMYKGSEETDNSVGDIFDRAGVPLTKAKNDRTGAGFAIAEWLGQTVTTGPVIFDDRGDVISGVSQKLQIYTPGCPVLAKTLPIMRVDPKHPGRIADSNKDHHTIALAYWAMSSIPVPIVKPPKQERESWRYPVEHKAKLGRESMRRRR